jgi:hypothetical protein
MCMMKISLLEGYEYAPHSTEAIGVGVVIVNLQRAISICM